MIPEFSDDGYLPPGIHQATLEEIAARSGRNPSYGKYKWSRSAVWSIWPGGQVFSDWS